MHIKKIVFILLVITLCGIFSKQSEAAVHFITKKDKIQMENDKKPCQLSGYNFKKINCGQNQTLYDKCPTGEFWKTCKCDPKFKFNRNNCSEDMLGGEICKDTEYTECGCNEERFPYTKENCPSPKVLDGETNCNNTHFPECNCPSEYKTCAAGMIEDRSSGECDGKYKKCICDPSIYFNCASGKGAAGAKTCADDYGTKYTTCEAAPCPLGTVDYNTYWNGELKFYIDKGKRVQTINSRLCATLPTCSEIGFNMSCSGHKSIKCPFDTSKTFCLIKKAETPPSNENGGGETVPSTPPSKTTCTEAYGYYNNNSCSNFIGVNCEQKYKQMGQQCSQQGNTPSHSAGTCDVDSWRGCCEECNGGI